MGLDVHNIECYFKLAVASLYNSSALKRINNLQSMQLFTAQDCWSHLVIWRWLCTPRSTG